MDTDILGIINDATKEADAFENHAAKDLPLEERLLYLQGLALVMNADGDIDNKEKEYLRILIKSFEMDESTLDSFVSFAQQPDKDTVQAFFKTFRRRPIAQLFLFDALMMSRRDNKVNDKEKQVVDKIANQLEILKGTQKDIYDLFCHIKNRDWQESSLYFSSHLLNPDHFKHLVAYHGLDLDVLLDETKGIQRQRLMERLLPDIEWIPLKYGNDEELPEQTEITSEFVNLTISYGMVTPFLQAMLDRGELRVANDKTYKVDRSGDTTEELLYFDIAKSALRFDQENRAFIPQPNQEDIKAEGLTSLLILDYWTLCSITINDIGYGKRYSADEDYVYFPGSAVNDEYIEGEIVKGYNGKFYVNERNGRLWSDGSTINSSDFSQLKPEEVLTSGKIRLTR